ncbi:MAG TPA: GNAT family N-acetyltransferase [Opitutus sp.]|nr:GNAT family N-acetyltransferase [Opitutus sp.]
MTAPPFTLRPATAADYPWLWALKRTTMRRYVEQTWGAWDDDAQEKFFRRSYSPATIQVVMADGREAGLLHVEHEPDEIFLANIQVVPGLQNAGLGTAVIQSLLEAAQRLHRPVRLQVLKVNTAAQRLYKRLGFAHAGETTTHQIMRWRPD